jgi:hypothetical protein
LVLEKGICAECPECPECDGWSKVEIKIAVPSSKPKVKEQ